MASASILVVDDETAIADLVEVYLSNEGFTVHKFHNAADALACVEREDLDLAILDVMLPDMDGFTLCQTHPAAPPVPHHHAHRPGGGHGQDHGPDPGGGRLYHQALQPSGAGGPGQNPAAPFHPVQPARPPPRRRSRSTTSGGSRSPRPTTSASCSGMSCL